MKLLHRYVIKRLTVMSLYSLLALLALYSFFDFVSEVGNLGDGNYTGFKMAQYIVYQIPAHAYELMPLAALIGGLIALNQLASGSELTVIKTSGMSTRTIIGMVLSFGLIFAIATALLGEWGAPTASKSAANLKAQAIDGKISTGRTGLWIKETNNIINVREMLPDQTLLGIKVWRHDDQFQLVESMQAESASVSDNNSWQLNNVKRSVLGDARVHTESATTENWQSGIQRSLLGVLLVDPEQMSVCALTTYIQLLKTNNQQTKQYEIAWWRKLMYPIAVLVMALVALAFTPQSTRHGNMGLKLFFGICLGLAFHFAGRLFGFTSQLYGVPPIIAAILPTLLFALLAVYLIRKQEKR